MPPPVPPTQIKKEREALKKVDLKRFGANPTTVPTFGTTTLSWSVTIPDSEFDIGIELNKQAVPVIGTKSLSLTQSTAFSLQAVTENAGRLLRRVTVNVDASDCESKRIDPNFIVLPIKREIDQQFSSSSKLKLKSKKSEVILRDGAIEVSVPLGINVPDWFDADMNIGFRIAVSGFSVVTEHVSVNVKWNFFEHLLSLGCTGFVQSGMEQLAREFMRHIVDAELIPRIATAFKGQADEFTAALQAADPQKRTFVTTRLTLTPAGVTIIACPRQGTESSRRVARTARARTTSGAGRPKSRSRGSR
jgi:hypothetical protein